MHSQNENVFPLHVSHARDTEMGFRRLADAAARGEIQGGAYTVINSRGQTNEGVLGLARVNHALAHYGASRLASMLLWPDEED